MCNEHHFWSTTTLLWGQIQSEFPLIMELLNYAKLFMDFFLKLTIVTLFESEHDCILDVIYSAVDVFLFQM